MTRALPSPLSLTMAKDVVTAAYNNTEDARIAFDTLAGDRLDDGARAAILNAAYSDPRYLGGGSPQRDDEGLLPPGSPYDQGRYDARKAVGKVLASLSRPAPCLPEEVEGLVDDAAVIAALDAAHPDWNDENSRTKARSNARNHMRKILSAAVPAALRSFAAKNAALEAANRPIIPRNINELLDQVSTKIAVDEWFKPSAAGVERSAFEVEAFARRIRSELLNAACELAEPYKDRAEAAEAENASLREQVTALQERVEEASKVIGAVRADLAAIDCEGVTETQSISGAFDRVKFFAQRADRAACQFQEGKPDGK